MTVFIAIDLQQPTKDAIIGVFTTPEKAEKGIDEYNSCTAYPSESIRVIEEELV